MPKRRAGGVVAVHPMGTGPGRGRRRADVDAPDPGAVRIEGEARPEQDLDRRVGAGDDVAPDVVRVVGLEIRRCPDGRCGYPLAEARGQALDLPQDRLRRVPGVAAWDVGVDPNGMQVAHGPARVREVLLADEDEGTLGHLAAVDRTLRNRDLLEGAGDVDGARPEAGLVGAWDPALHRQVELERARAVPIAAVGTRDPRGQAIACDLGNGRRGE